ncbi:CDGSH iron-sulfur domain-containing protein [Streptomyces marincola]|nr:CDGSH iron-sulfur domain-containing protein [Streptomyces marincola]UCM91785.1 CDGSH iron-sulfur domain-containing protein [Streptomyces marincola]
MEGPVEFVLDDGTVVRSDRPVVALCTCRRSRRFPFCDTSHRRRSKPLRRTPGREPGKAARVPGEDESQGSA